MTDMMEMRWRSRRWNGHRDSDRNRGGVTDREGERTRDGDRNGVKKMNGGSGRGGEKKKKLFFCNF